MAEELNRVPISVSLPPAVVSWLDRKVESRVYASRSHAIELLVRAAAMQEQSARPSAATQAGFSADTHEFHVSDEDEAMLKDVRGRFTKAMEEASALGIKEHVVKVTIKGQQEPSYYYRIRTLAEKVDSSGSRQEYLAIRGDLMPTKLIVISRRDPTGMMTAVEASEEAIDPKQYGLTGKDVVPLIQRFIKDLS